MFVETEFVRRLVGPLREIYRGTCQEILSIIVLLQRAFERQKFVLIYKGVRNGWRRGGGKSEDLDGSQHFLSQSFHSLRPAPKALHPHIFIIRSVSYNNFLSPIILLISIIKNVCRRNHCYRLHYIESIHYWFLFAL